MSSLRMCSVSEGRGRTRGAVMAIATLAALGAGVAPACARVRPQSNLLVLAPFGMVEGLSRAARFHLTPRPPTHRLASATQANAPVATVAEMKLAPKVVTQFAPPPPGMVNGVALGGMVLPARLVDPYVAYQPRPKGPIVELGVAGGGMPTQAGLAHVGMHWTF